MADQPQDQKRPRKKSYAEILKAPAPKLIKSAQVTINAHEIKEFVKAQKQAKPINEISTRKVNRSWK